MFCVNSPEARLAEHERVTASRQSHKGKSIADTLPYTNDAHLLKGMLLRFLFAIFLSPFCFLLLLLLLLFFPRSHCIGREYMRAQDKDLDEMGDLIAEMKANAIKMNSHLETGNKRLDKLNERTERTDEHMKRNTDLCIKYT
jgi:hypothetical protein